MENNTNKNNGVNISRNIDKISGNLRNNESNIYYKKFREYIKLMNEPNESEIIKNNKKLVIYLEFFDSTKRGLFFEYEDEKNEDGTNKKYNVHELRKNGKWLWFEDIVKALKEKKIDLYVEKKIDPNIIEVLYNEKGEYAVCTYLRELNKGKNANKEILPFKMNYNLKSIWNNRGLSFIEKLRLSKMINQNKYIANHIEKDPKIVVKIGRRIATAFAAVGLLFNAVPKLASSTIENQKKLNEKNSVSDTFERTATNSTQTDKNQVITTKDYNQEKTETVTKQTESYKLTKEEKERILKQTERIIEEHNNKDSASIKKDNNRDNTKIEKQDNNLELGNVLQLPVGLKFMEGVSGGKTGEIGDSGSPADGVYVVDHYAEVSENGISNVSGLTGKIQKSKTDCDSFVHISYVTGAKNIKEAKDIINSQKKEAETGKIDNNRIQPRGWVSAKTIEDIYKMQQKNNEAEIDIEK